MGKKQKEEPAEEAEEEEEVEDPDTFESALEDVCIVDHSGPPASSEKLNLFLISA